MRKWKIRTKIVAGLFGLAIVIGLLVYSSWSQSARDRYLASDITQLASDIKYAHELQHWAGRLDLAYSQIEEIQHANFRMIESDRVDELGDLPSLELGSSWNSEFELCWGRLDGILTDCLTEAEQEQADGQLTPLLVDREQRTKSIQALRDEFNAANALLISDEEQRPEDSVLEIYDAGLHAKLTELSVNTQEHFRAIQDSMAGFQDKVSQGQDAKRAGFRLYTGMSAFLIAFLFWQFWIFIVVPFRTLFSGSQLIASGHHQHKILLGTDDEIGQMADTVNDITERFNVAMDRVTLAKRQAEQEVRDRTREVIQNEQLASVGFLAAGVAHEINNPLGAIAWSAEALEETVSEMGEEERARIEPGLLLELETNLGLIQSEAFRCKEITERLLNFSRLSDRTREQEDIGLVVQQVVAMVGKVGEYRCKKIESHIDPDVKAYCNSQEIQQVVLNLVSNALESVDTDGTVNVTVRNEIDPLSGVKQAMVVIQDDGCGMDQEVLNHLFEPFFTRRRDDSGTGLGLSISYRIVSLHHGSLTPYSEGEGKGARMVLRLPIEREPNEVVASLNTLDKRTDAVSSSKWNDVEKIA